MYIEELTKKHTKNKSQVSKTMFLAKYGSMALYDEDMEKYLSLTMKYQHLIKLMGGL